MPSFIHSFIRSNGVNSNVTVLDKSQCSSPVGGMLFRVTGLLLLLLLLQVGRKLVYNKRNKKNKKSLSLLTNSSHSSLTAVTANITSNGHGEQNACTSKATKNCSQGTEVLTALALVLSFACSSAGWRHALRSEWPFIIIIISI